MSDTIEIMLAGKRYSISLAPLSPNAKIEVKDTLTKGEMSAIDLLKAYITKTQENALLYQDIENLNSSIENRSTQILDVISIDTPTS